MLRLTFFPFHPDAIEKKRIGLPYKTPAELAVLRQWQDIDFIGIPTADFLAFASIIQTLKTIRADTSHNGGMRIRFHCRATYGSLIATLDAMSTFNQKRYWLASKNEPLTLYVLTTRSEYKAEDFLIL